MADLGIQSKFLDRFQSTDEILKEILRELRKQNHVEQDYDKPRQYQITQEVREEVTSPQVRNILALTHPSYFGFPLGRSSLIGFSGNSNTSGAEIIRYVVPSENYAIVRKLSVPFAATEFGTLQFELNVDGQNILSEASGIIDQTTWFEGVNTDREIVVKCTEGDTAQAIKVLLQVLLVTKDLYNRLNRRTETT
jgi:hypothetical protein